MSKELSFRFQLDENESGLTKIKTTVEVDGKQLGLITYFRVETTVGATFPSIEVGVLDSPGFDWDRLSDESKQSVRTSVELLRQFFFIHVRTFVELGTPGATSPDHHT